MPVSIIVVQTNTLAVDDKIRHHLFELSLAHLSMSNEYLAEGSNC